MAIPVWLAVLIASVGIIAFLWQVRRARFNQSIDLLFRVKADFFGTNKKMQRVKASSDLARRVS